MSLETDIAAIRLDVERLTSLASGEIDNVHPDSIRTSYANGTPIHIGTNVSLPFQLYYQTYTDNNIPVIMLELRDPFGMPFWQTRLRVTGSAINNA